MEVSGLYAFITIEPDHSNPVNMPAAASAITEEIPVLNPSLLLSPAINSYIIIAATARDMNIIMLIISLSIKRRRRPTAMQINPITVLIIT